MLHEYLVGLTQLTDAVQGDMNRDGEINISDLIQMKRELTGS